MGTLIDTTFDNLVGETCRVVLEKDGYTGTAYGRGSVRVTDWRIARGAKDALYSIVRQNTNAGVTVSVDSSAVISELKGVYSADRTFTLTLKRGGTTRFKGYLQGNFVRTPKIEDEERSVELRATPEVQTPDQSDLTTLSGDWLDSNGDRFTETQTFATAIADILGRTGFSFPIEAVIQWRPTSMGPSDDPLSAEFRTDAFYRTGSDGQLRAQSAGKVLESLCGILNAQVALGSGVWRVVQPEAYADGADVDVWEYDATGTLKSGQSTTESTTVDLTGETWESDRDDPSVRGISPVNDSRVVYEYGPEFDVSRLQGGFESMGEAGDLWDYYDNDVETNLSNVSRITTQTNSTYVRSGSKALEIEENQVAAGTDVTNFPTAIEEDYAENRIATVDSDITGMRLFLRAMPRIVDEDNDYSTQPDTARLYWALGLTPSQSGEDYFYVVSALNFDTGGAWVLESNLNTNEKYNLYQSEDFLQPQNYTETTVAVSEVPEGGALYIRLYHPVSRPTSGNDGSGYTVYANWDDIDFEAQLTEEPAFTARSTNESVESGQTVERTTRLGTGPFRDADGYVLDNSGDPVEHWSVLGKSESLRLQRLAARRILRLRELPREWWTPTFVNPSTEPKIGQGIEHDETRYWPRLIQERQPGNVFELSLSGLALGTSSTDDSELSGRSTESTPSRRVIQNLTDLNDTQIGNLQDGRAVAWSADKGAFTLQTAAEAVPELQSETAAYPSGADPKRFTADDQNNPVGSIQSAIDYAADNGGGHIVISRDLTGWDTSQVSHDPSVIHYLEGQQGAGYNVKAYGAIGDGSTDDHAAFQKAHDQAEAASKTTPGRRQRLLVPQPEPEEDGYLLGKPWRITMSATKVVGSGKYNCEIGVHSSFDDTSNEALVVIGDGAGQTGSETSSVVVQDLNIDGRGREISALKMHYWYSANVENCTLRAGTYDPSGLDREVGGLHVRSGKNLYVRECQIATSDGHGVLVDDRGDSGNNHTDNLKLVECHITENVGNVVVHNGAFDVQILGGHLSGPSGSASQVAAGHNVLFEGGGKFQATDVRVDHGTYGIVGRPSGRREFRTNDVRFQKIDRQSIVDDGGNYTHSVHKDNTFARCGTDHVDGGAIGGDYTTSEHVADIHIKATFGGITHLQGNTHIRDDSAPDDDRHAAIVSADGNYDTIHDAPNAYNAIINNVPFKNGYLARNGDVVHAGQHHYMDNDTINFDNVGEEAAGAGNTPSASKWNVGDFVLNTDDNPSTLFLLKPSGDWFDFQSGAAADIGNDGTIDIPEIGIISSQNDPQGVVSEGGGISELLYDFDPLPYKAEDETITGQWQYEQEIDWTNPIKGIGYEGYVQIPVDNAAQTEYILISELDGNGTNQRLSATLFVGRKTASSVNDHGAIEVYYNQNSTGGRRNFATRAVVDTEKANEGFDARPVAIDYNSARWAAVEVSVGFDKILWRTLSPHHTGNYDLQAVAAKSSSNVSNVTAWENASEGSLAREEIRAKSLMHDESRSFDFQSGWASGDGWIAAERGPDGKPNFFEASHMVLRGTLRVRELILEQLRVRKGIQIISPGGGKLERVESEVDASIDASEFYNWSITAVDTSADTVTLDDSSGDLDPTATLGAGQKIAISDSTGNNGNYTIASISDNGDGTTTVEVNETISDSTADGQLFEATVQKWYFEDPNDTASAHGMQSGDRVLAQRFDPEQQQVVAQVRAVVELVYTTHEVEVTVSTNYTVPDVGQETEGYEFAVVASARGNRQSILVDSPFQPGREVLDGLTDFDDWDNRADFLRKLSGNLDGRYDYSGEAYGLAAGPTDGEYITADSVKGVRMVDNTGGNQTVRAQLSGSTLTLGATGAEHIKIDPNQSGLQFINASGTEVGRFDGTLLRLGFGGQIRFDPSQSPEATIEGTLMMKGYGKIIDDASPPNYRLSSKGIELRATNTARAEAREITWREPDLTGGIRGEIYTHNYEMNINTYYLGGKDAKTILTAYDYAEGVTPGAGDDYARIELFGDGDGRNEINMILRGDGDVLNIRSEDSGGIAFDFDPHDDYLGFKNVYDYSSDPGPSPPTPSDGIRLYTKEADTDQERPLLWFIDSNGDQYRVTASKIT